MIRTMRSKMLLSVAALMLATIATIVFFVWASSSNTIRKQQEAEAMNLLAFTRLQVEAEYRSILSYKEQSLSTRKQALRHVIDAAFSSVQVFYQQAQAGKMSESEAKREALRILQNVRYDSGVGYIWVNDTSRPFTRMIMHPEIPALDGTVLDDPSYNCALGKNENLFSAFRDVCEEHGEGYVDYNWPKPLPNGTIGPDEPKISFVRLFKPWGWVIGTGLYIDDIEDDASRRLDEVKQDLQQTFLHTEINNNGYVFIFGENNQFIVHPDPQINSFKDQVNPQTGNIIYEDMKQAVHNGATTFTYNWNKPYYDRERFIYPKITYLTYFEPLQWYIGATFYIADIDRTANLLRNRIVLISLLFLLLGIGAAYLLSRHITAPLKKLALAANHIREHGDLEQKVIEAGPTETVELGKVLNQMLASLNDARHSLIESREDLRITLHSIGDAVIATDVNDNITRMNPVAEALTGWHFEEAQGKHIEQVLHLLDQHTRDKILAPSSQVIATGKLVSFDAPVLLVHRSGSECFISDSAAPIIDYNGIVVGAVIVFRNITNQIESEKQLRQRQKMDSIGQLAGGIAHDFNNMLAGILGFAELLGLQADELDQDRKLVDGIIKSSLKASELVSKLLSFARETPLIHREFTVHDTLDDAVTLLHRSLDRSIEVIVEKKAKNYIIKGDATQIENAILNLGINASDAMPHGGRLTFETDNVMLDKAFCNASQFDLTAGEYIMLKCIDTGAGIPIKLLDKIFEPYFTTKEVGKGTGLGLAAVYGTIISHHGAIFVYSEIGKGTAFHIYLPVVQTEIETSEAQPAQVAIHGSGGILVIDDEQLVRMMAHEVLKELGYTVYLASDGEEGVTMYKQFQSKIDAVIMDMVMPHMTGEDCFAELKKIDPDVKVIVSSGFAKTDKMTHLLQDGAVGYIKKPYTMIGISQILAKVFHPD